MADDFILLNIARSFRSQSPDNVAKSAEIHAWLRRTVRVITHMKILWVSPSCTFEGEIIINGQPQQFTVLPTAPVRDCHYYQSWRLSEHHLRIFVGKNLVA